MTVEEQEIIPIVSCRPPEMQTEEARMSIGDHLAELRVRLAICVGVFALAFFCGFIFYREMWDIIRLPIIWTAGQMGKEPGDLIRFQGLGPIQGFVTIARIDLLLALVLTSPIVIYEIWRFVSPGLTRREKRAIFAILSFGSFMFALGAAIAFRFAVPIGLRFLLQFNAGLEQWNEQWTGQEYLGFVTMSCLGFGACFELPLVMMALARVGLITPEGVLRYWRHAVLLMVVLGAVFTPPDPFTQIMLASMLTALFFLGYGLMRLAARKESDGEPEAE
jgi:sec-independent protein translocase protein TatC